MNDFITIDFETAASSRDSAIAIGLVKYRNYKPIESYYSLIRPPRLYVRRDFTAIHGLTVDDVKDAPDFKHIWESEVKEFIGTTILAAHYASFDMGVLRAVLEHYELPIPELQYFCSCRLSKKVWPVYNSHSLSKLAAQHNIIYDAHNALADAETCGKIITLCAREISAALKKRSGKSARMSLRELLDEVNVKVKKLK